MRNRKVREKSIRDKIKQKGNPDFFTQGVEEEASKDYFTERKDMRELIAAEGFKRPTEEYVTISDGGKLVYVMSLYPHKLPKQTKFATTFAPLFNYPGVTSNVFIAPLGETKSQQTVDRRVRTLSVERDDALDSRDVNRIRKMSRKYDKAQNWAAKIEEGDNSLYSVQFLFTLFADSKEALYRNVDDFRARAKQKDIEIVSCYALQTEAFMSAYPLNHIEEYKNVNYITPHVLDRHSVGDLFNHTSCSFIHQNGVYLGHYLKTLQAFFYDPFDRSHDGFGAMFCGATGVGKSACIKMLQSRLADFGVRFRTLDIESRSSHGEYTLTSEAAGGINFDIKANGKNKLNPFDINSEMEFDEATGAEYLVLRLAEKRAYLVDLFMSMVKLDGEEVSVTLGKAMSSILSDMVATLYSERGIIDGQPDSLYHTGGDNFLESGRTRKQMPTITDAFKWLLINKKLNDNRLHDEAYQVLVDTMREQVKEVYYGKESIRFFTKEEYEAMEVADNGRHVTKYENGTEIVIPVIGSKPYFDGQSTLRAEFETPYINYDISQIPEADRKFATLVLLGYMEENDIKPNSANPLRATPLIILVDELHKLFPYVEARRCIERFYRTARKRWVGPWIATQSVADCGDKTKYPELEGVFKNTDTYFLFRHQATDRDYLRKNTCLTEAQIERVFELGIDPSDPDVSAEEKKRRTGEICVIDKGRVAFIKVDYLEETEAEFVETNVEKIRKRYIA